MGRKSTRASGRSRVRANDGDTVTNKLLNRLQGEAQSYPKEALSKPGQGTAFEYGVHHGYVKALSHVEQWLQELLEEEEGDESE